MGYRRIDGARTRGRRIYYFDGWRRHLAQLRETGWKTNEGRHAEIFEGQEDGPEVPGVHGPQDLSRHFVRRRVCETKRLGHHRRPERRRRADEWCERNQSVPGRARRRHVAHVAARGVVAVLG